MKAENHTRFVVRILKKLPHCTHAKLVLGHHHLAAGTPALAALCYKMVYETLPDEPLVSLCCGIAYHRMVLYAHLTHLKYSELIHLKLKYFFSNYPRYSVLTAFSR